MMAMAMRVDLGGDEHGAEIHGEDTGVDGVADDLVGSGADELVAGGDADFSAPIGAEVAAGPDGEGDPGGFDEEAEGLEEMCREQDLAGEAGDGKDEEQDAEVEDDEVKLARPAGFGGLGGGGAFSDAVPEDGEEADEDDSGDHR
jgi:hypothetical protein